MTKNQSKAHWWIVENHPGFEVKPPSKYIEICDIVFDALKQGQSLPTDSVSDTLLIDNPINFMCWLRNWGHLEESETIKEDFEELILQYKSVSNVDHSNDR